MTYYECCCQQRLVDLIKYVSKVFPGQTINGDYVIRNARLRDIAKGSNSTQRIIDFCRKKIEQINE